MSFSDWLGQSWDRHATDAQGVFETLDHGAALASTGADLVGLVGLITHVAGEHLGHFDDVDRLLGGLRTHPAFDPAGPEAGAVHRGLAALACMRGDADAEHRWLSLSPTPGVPAGSDLARVRLLASAFLAGRGRFAEAGRLLEAALQAASYGPDKVDPVSRALAVMGNNLASSLEEQPGRDAEADAFMVRAAEVGRQYWEIAGTWLHVERAEYRLSRSLCHAGRAGEAAAHARLCLEVCAANDAPAEERFYGSEALALALVAGGDLAGARAAREAMAGLLGQVPADWAEWCQGSLAAVDAKLAD